MNNYKILPSTLQVLKPLCRKKAIYTTLDDPSLFIKVLTTKDRTKKDILNEIRMQKKAYKLGINTPKIKDYYWYQNKMYIIMERIMGNNLASIYGTNPNSVPGWIWKKIHTFISELYDNEIEYTDITPYNFVKGVDGKVYIIDFEHATMIDYDNVDWFVEKMLDGAKSWNPDFE